MRTRAPARPTPSVVKMSPPVVPAVATLLARRPHQDRVLVLRHIRALDVTQRRVGLDDADVAEVLQSAEIFSCAAPALPCTAADPPSGRSSHLLQNASVPKVLLICDNSFLARGIRKGT